MARQRTHIRWTFQYILANVSVIEVEAILNTPIYGWNEMQLDATTSFELLRYQLEPEVPGEHRRGHYVSTGYHVTKENNPNLWHLLMQAAEEDLSEIDAALKRSEIIDAA